MKLESFSGGAMTMTTSPSSVRLAMRILGMLAALASTAAVALVAAPSFGGKGVAEFLQRIPMARDSYAAFSRAYDALIARLAGEVLADPRDAPALRIMVSLSLTALPIFLIQLALGEPVLWLVAAFYLSLYGLRLQRFVRMFSAKHLEAHRPRGFFSGIYARIFGRYVEFLLGYLYGNVPEIDRTMHVRLHHREHNGRNDISNSDDFDHTNRLHFFLFLSKHFWTTIGVAPYLYFKQRGETKNQERMLLGITKYFAFFGVIFLYRWQIGVWYVLVPLLTMNFLTGSIAWVQHAFYDPERPEDYFAQTVTVMDDENFMNEGYHLGHHHRPALHWTEMPAHFEEMRDRMMASGSMVFRDVDFTGLFLEMTLLRRLDTLADKLVTWEPMNHEQKREFLMRRAGGQVVPVV